MSEAAPVKFALNRTCAPGLDLAGFIALARDAGVAAVEIRNDIAGRELDDGIPAAEVRARLDEAGLAVASVNALQRFNDWSTARESEAVALVRHAADLGAPGLVLCPRHDADHGWSGAEAEKRLREGLRHLRPILTDHGVIGYIEPLGMRGSTLTRQATAVAAVDDIDGRDAFALCYDTFQAYRCGDRMLCPDRVGLAHMSGILRTDLPPDALSEPDRGLVVDGDRVGNVARLRALRATGYDGFISMEPFSPEVQQDPDLGARLAASLAHVGQALARPES